MIRGDPEFHEDIQNLKQLDPLYSPNLDFDYEAVDRALGFNFDDMEETNREQLATVIVALVQWFCAPKLRPDGRGYPVDRLVYRLLSWPAKGSGTRVKQSADCGPHVVVPDHAVDSLDPPNF